MVRTSLGELFSQRFVDNHLHRLHFPLIIRNFEPGDRLHPFGMTGSQKLKKLFGDRKIPKDLRGRIPLLVSGEQIAWVAGVRRGRMAAISSETTQVLIARWRPAKPHHGIGGSSNGEYPEIA